ncbi:MAG: RNA polymerase subunit sigma-24 [Gammaproteobacteria bacterium HGW-Gammaproteobacteria-8]|nr:MAG: RNA polymerase subunit sigma-24 [Gammaproteobacteria bacterium HGW-Gammaproteobacteria-8]
MNDAHAQSLSDAAADRDGDGACVAAARRGDRAAFEGLYRRHAGWLLPVLWRLAGGDRARAEDWLQEAFVLAWQKLDQLRDDDAFPAWLKRLAVNLALAEQRRGRLVLAEGTIDRAAPEPPWPAADLDLERAIVGLPERARQVLVLFHLAGLGHAEIGQAMGIDPGTSKAQLHRARSLLKERLA